MNIKKKNLQRGQAIIIATIFFTVISSIISIGLAYPAIAQVRAAHDLTKSKQTYFLAEAGIEDAVYRIRNAITIDASEVLSLNSETVTTNIVETASEVTIVAEGESEDYLRKVETKLRIGEGIAFSYGVLIGTGGLVLEPNAGIVGNIYANGDVIGANNAYVTGSAIAANSVALTTDVTNDTPTIPGAALTFGNANATQDTAQSFQVLATNPLNRVDIYLKKTGSPSDITVKIVSDSSGSPGPTVLSSGTISASQITTSYGWVSLGFSSNPVLTVGNTYWIVLDASTGSASKKYDWATNTTYSNGLAKIGQFDGSWSTASPASDGYFKIFTGGIVSKISDVDVGTETVSDAYAHEVINSTASGLIYCQIGSGNNKSCNTSRPDPAPQVFPISDALIDSWKEAAEEGGVILGDYTVSSNVSLGAKKITGNLLIKNGKTLTMTGALYVGGHVEFENNGKIKLHSSFGEDSGFLITDGTIKASNGSMSSGSGDLNSFLMMMSLSECSGVPSSGCADDYSAVDLVNGSINDIIYAPRGYIYYHQGAQTKEVTAWKLKLENTAQIEYNFGVRDTNFITGPSGGWSIGSWKEVE